MLTNIQTKSYNRISNTSRVRDRNKITVNEKGNYIRPKDHAAKTKLISCKRFEPGNFILHKTLDQRLRTYVYFSSKVKFTTLTFIMWRT